MERTLALPFISYLLDEIGNQVPYSDVRDDAVLFGWNVGFGPPIFIAVQSMGNAQKMDEADALAIALRKVGAMPWFGASRQPDYVIK